ncbi:MAG: aminotransferase class V [Rhodothermaceae bacterium]|nr:MAG: aminotransferase class V [Rhodothermaceae bacterium]
MSIDVARARQETPGCDDVIHFNNAGMALPPLPVLDAQIQHLRREARIGGYEAAAEARPALEHTYDAIARMLGCHRDEIALVENATRAWDMVFYAFPFKPGDRILTCRAAYASNFIACLQVARRTGARIDVVPSDPHGQLSLEALAARLDERVKLIVLTHVPTNGGLVNPAAEVGRLARDAGIPYLLDACQSAGQMPLNVDALGCTMLSATGRKYLRGPRGTGFLYVRRDWIERLEPPLLDLHAATWVAPNRYEIRSDARRFETWEGYVAGKIALGVAVDYALRLGLEAIQQRVVRLAEHLRQRLGDLPGIHVHDLGPVRCGIVTFSADFADATRIRDALRMHRINVSVSTPSSTLLDATARNLPDLVRASVHYYNTGEEIEHLCDLLASLRGVT